MLLPADVQLPTPPRKQRQPTRGSHVMKTRSQDTPKQSGSSFENMKFKKKQTLQLSARRHCQIHN